MRYVIELKQTEPSIAQPLCDMLREYNLQERTIVGSFHPQAMYEFRQACPEVATSAVEEEIRPMFILSLAGMTRAYQPNFHALQIPQVGGGFNLTTPQFWDAALERGVVMQTWTINSEEDMRAMIDLAVNGIITDYPTRLMQLLGRP
jgi:glycerophosphoryl diester phosphodiesterase